MRRGVRAVSAAVLFTAAVLVIRVETAVDASSGAVQLQLGREYIEEGRYDDALDAFKKALALAEPDDQRAARAGVIQAALRVAEFDLARSEAEKLVAQSPTSPEASALYADA